MTSQIQYCLLNARKPLINELLLITQNYSESLIVEFVQSPDRKILN